MAQNKMNLIDVSIIIINYNTFKLTQDCIDSIIEKTQGINYEILVVDNASTDGSKDCFEHDDRITYIYSGINGGFGYGNNIGIRVAKGKYFFLLNSDTLLINNAIKEFYDYAEMHDSKTIYGCYLRGQDGAYRNSFFYFPAFTIRQFLDRQIHPQNYQPDYTNKEVECICGADMFIPRKAIDEAGLFDDNIFLYGEEGELQYRMMQKGYSRTLINTPKIIHLEGKSMDNSPVKRKIKLASHYYILKKYMPYWKYLCARCYYSLNLSIRKVILAIKSK